MRLLREDPRSPGHDTLTGVAWALRGVEFSIERGFPAVGFLLVTFTPFVVVVVVLVCSARLYTCCFRGQFVSCCSNV